MLFTLKTLFCLFVLIGVFTTHSTYADEFSYGLPSVSSNNISVVLNNTISNQNHNMFLQLRLEGVNGTISHTTFKIILTKQNHVVLNDLFHTHSGILTLDFSTINGSRWIIHSSQEPILSGWLGGIEPISVQIPDAYKGTRYHIHIEVFTIENDRNLFTSDQAPTFDTNISQSKISILKLIQESTSNHLVMFKKHDGSVIWLKSQTANTLFFRGWGEFVSEGHFSN